jgi:hypothetical protein
MIIHHGIEQGKRERGKEVKRKKSTPRDKKERER